MLKVSKVSRERKTRLTYRAIGIKFILIFYVNDHSAPFNYTPCVPLAIITSLREKISRISARSRLLRIFSYRAFRTRNSNNIDYSNYRPRCDEANSFFIYQHDQITFASARSHSARTSQREIGYHRRESCSGKSRATKRGRVNLNISSFRSDHI